MTGKVKVRGPQAGRISGGMMKMVAATCSENLSSGVALFEPLESGFPAGLLASPALIRVTRGTAYVPIVNVGTTDALLFPRRAIGTLTSLYDVSPPPGVAEIRPLDCVLNWFSGRCSSRARMDRCCRFVFSGRRRPE